MMSKRKIWTNEERDEIIEYARIYGIWSVKAKYNIWPETVRYWMNPDLRASRSESGKLRHSKLKGTDQYEAKRKESRLKQKLSGESQKRWSEWYNSLSDKERQYQADRVRQHRVDNIEHYKKLSKKRYQRDKKSGKYRERYNEDPLHKLRCNIREHVRQAIKYSNISKDHPSIKYLGCDIEEFKQHIESQFRDGMSWDNHSRGEASWHLDHIKPLALLKDINDIDALKVICHYTNYQPLWEKENLQKQDKYEE